MLNAMKDRYEFPELRRVAKEQYDYWEPETVLIESNASGLPLTYELRNMGIPVVNYTPSRGNDKHTRVNSVAPLFESGKHSEFFAMKKWSRKALFGLMKANVWPM